MAQKFIVTQNGFLRLGIVRMHKDLLQAGDVCLGGGFYKIDYVSNRIILDGGSFDFGAPRWNRVVGSLKVPMSFRGFQLVYQSNDSYSEFFDVTGAFEIEYV